MLLNLKIFWSQLPEKFWFWWAWRLPKKLVYFAAIRLVAFATQGEYGNTVVSELPAMEAIGRWERGLTKRAPDAGESGASQALSPQSGESTPEVNPAATQRR